MKDNQTQLDTHHDELPVQLLFPYLSAAAVFVRDMIESVSNSDSLVDIYGPKTEY
jgi:hypothetical protein